MSTRKLVFTKNKKTKKNIGNRKKIFKTKKSKRNSTNLTKKNVKNKHLRKMKGGAVAAAMYLAASRGRGGPANDNDNGPPPSNAFYTPSSVAKNPEPDFIPIVDLYKVYDKLLSEDVTQLLIKSNNNNSNNNELSKNLSQFLSEFAEKYKDFKQYIDETSDKYVKNEEAKIVEINFLKEYNIKIEEIKTHNEELTKKVKELKKLNLLIEDVNTIFQINRKKIENKKFQTNINLILFDLKNNFESLEKLNNKKNIIEEQNKRYIEEIKEKEREKTEIADALIINKKTIYDYNEFKIKSEKDFNESIKKFTKYDTELNPESKTQLQSEKSTNASSISNSNPKSKNQKIYEILKEIAEIYRKNEEYIVFWKNKTNLFGMWGIS